VFFDPSASGSLVAISWGRWLFSGRRVQCWH